MPVYDAGNVGHGEPKGADPDVSGVDRVIARLASRQHGLVSRIQLLAAGISVWAIEHRVKTGRLVAIYRGVYAVGHTALSDHARVQAALLAAGPTAVASHRTAAALWGLTPSMPAVIDVTVTGHARRRRETMRIHETRHAPDRRTLHGLRLTAPLRTLADLRATRPTKEVERATSEALALRLVGPEQLDDPPTRSELERKMLRLIRGAGLPEPLVNHRIGPYLVDFAWPEHGLIVETDGYATHGHRAAFERDRARDQYLQAAGHAVMRFTHRQVTGEPLRVAATLARRIPT